MTLVELSATTGLLSDYLAQIEDGKVQPLESDLKRIERTLLKAKSDPERMRDLAEREKTFDPEDVRDFNDLAEDDSEKY